MMAGSPTLLILALALYESARHWRWRSGDGRPLGRAPGGGAGWSRGRCRALTCLLDATVDRLVVAAPLPFATLTFGSTRSRRSSRC
ncbi:MAG: hypothetical protein U0893_12015 [Chloroflexota bacterium]